MSSRNSAYRLSASDSRSMFDDVQERFWESPRLDSTQTGGDLSNFRGRVFLSQRRTGEEELAHGEASDEDRFEADAADESLGEGDSFRIVASDRHTDEAARAVGDHADPPIADRVERPHDARPRQQLGAGQPGAALLVHPLHQLGTVTPRDGVADVQHQRLGGERAAVRLTDL